jgi:hypothetical protein
MNKQTTTKPERFVDNDFDDRTKSLMLEIERRWHVRFYVHDDTTVMYRCDVGRETTKDDTFVVLSDLCVTIGRLAGIKAINEYSGDFQVVFEDEKRNLTMLWFHMYPTPSIHVVC